MARRVQIRAGGAVATAGVLPPGRETRARRRGWTPSAGLGGLDTARGGATGTSARLDTRQRRVAVVETTRWRPGVALTLSLLMHVALGVVLTLSELPRGEAQGEPAIEVTLVSAPAPVGDAEVDARAAPVPEIAVDAPHEAAALIKALPDIPLPDRAPQEPEAEPAAPPVSPDDIASEAVVTVAPAVDVDVPMPERVAEVPVIAPPLEPVAPEPVVEVAAPAEVNRPQPQPAVEAAVSAVTAEPIAPTKPAPTVMIAPTVPVAAPEPRQPKSLAKPPARAAEPRPVKQPPVPARAAAVSEVGRNKADRDHGRAATGGAGGPTSTTLAQWRGQVQAAILRAKPAPDNDREGVARVGFSVTRGGQLSGVRLATSSGVAGLDAAALAAVRRAAPFPPVPNDVAAPVALEVPIRFQID